MKLLDMCFHGYEKIEHCMDLVNSHIFIVQIKFLLLKQNLRI